MFMAVFKCKYKCERLTPVGGHKNGTGPERAPWRVPGVACPGKGGRRDPGTASPQGTGDSRLALVAPRSPLPPGSIPSGASGEQPTPPPPRSGLMPCLLPISGLEACVIHVTKTVAQAGEGGRLPPPPSLRSNYAQMLRPPHPPRSQASTDSPDWTGCGGSAGVGGSSGQRGRCPENSLSAGLPLSASRSTGAPASPDASRPAFRPP